MMNAAKYLRLTVSGVAMVIAGLAAAQEPPAPAEPLHQRERVRNMGAEDSNAQREQIREQMQERVRAMTPEEQRLMRETGVDARARMESRQSAQGDGTRRGSGEGGGYGKGYESRRSDGSGSGGGGGGGRGMGGGRHR